MKQTTTIKKLKDGAFFKLSKYSKVTYELITKKKGMATFTSTSSSKSYVKSVGTIVYI